MLDLAVLGLLADQPCHGYDLRKRLSETLGPLWGISFGSLYPALRRLERSGSVEVIDADGEATAPPVSTGSLSGDLAAARLRRRARPGRRTRKEYRITEAGRTRFGELLATEPADDERGFALKLSFCGHLPPEERLAFLERRRSLLAERLASSKRRPVGGTIDRYTRSLLEHRATSTRHDIEWIDDLIAQERAEQAGDRTEGATT